jgi:hypothetical protein
MLISDVASLEWEVLRWRRLELTLIRARGLAALERFLANQLEYCSYADHFADDLEGILKDHVKEGEDPHSLARGYAENEMGAVQQIKTICDYNRVYLHDSRLDLQDIMNRVRDRKAKELVQQYARGEPVAAATVRELLSNAGVSMDSFMADALAKNLDVIERIDRLTAIAETRRNASLNEIERRRIVLGGALRRSVQEIEDAEFKVIETTAAKKKSAA